jgi:S-DNA-T family DNA segregation ATPase FtsK/SpoIIIE
LSKQINTTDFLATFFVGDYAVTKKLSDVVKNKSDKLFREGLRLPKQFALPFTAEKESSSETPLIRYFLKSSTTAALCPFINESLCEIHNIANGDYITFKNGKGEIAFSILFIATSSIKVGYKKFALQTGENIFIGRENTNQISYTLSERVSREKHIAVRMDNDGSVYVEDLKRSVGVYVNGKRTHSQKLSLFDEVFIMGLSVVNCGSFVAVRDLAITCNHAPVTGFNVKNPVENSESEVKYFVRTPRILKSLDTDTFEIESPPKPPTADKTPAILTMGPSVTMALIMLISMGASLANTFSDNGNMTTAITSGVMAVGMLITAILWPSLLRSYQKRSLAAEDKNRCNRYTQYIGEFDKKLSAKNARAVRILNENLNPSPEQLCKLLDDEQSRLHLWERSHDDSDFLYVRLGLGRRESFVNITTPKSGFQLQDDDLRLLPLQIAEKHTTLSGVPVTLDLLKSGILGIIGSKTNVQNIVSELILNVAALHSYDEVKLVIVVSENESKNYDYIKNIPHVWSNDKKMRYFATTNDEVHSVFNAIDEIVKERESKENDDEVVIPSLPYFVVIVTDETLIEGEPFLRYIENPDNNVGVVSLFAYCDISKLPKNCRAVIQTDNSRNGYYCKNQNNNRFIEFTPDTIPQSVGSFMSKLSSLPVRVDARSLSVPDRVSFLQMYKVGNITELEIEKYWGNNNSAKSLAAPIGLMAGNVPFLLDVHEAYHGCHGLVAGTTGSGKSEFLQAFVLSLAINYSPKEVAFVLVDFKGGDMARPFMAKPTSPALPHLAATISNLSGNLLYRALVSFNAEIKYRQSLFNKSATILGVDKLDINSYHKYYKSGKLQTPLPHLIIIIDEFAQLKTQQPDFLAELINVAQVGRSLGIHLILATQKPSGVVDPQIWSNSRFKVCLKVADKQDSMDMIGKPDSALIKNPGRCYVQVGYDEIYECVQSGYSGADYTPTKTYLPDDEIIVRMTDNTATPIHSQKLNLTSEESDKTQLEAIVSKMVELGISKNLFVKPLWKDMLSEKAILDTLEKSEKTLLRATFALADFVKTQEQHPLDIDFCKSGNIAIYGASGTGKTTLLQTLVYSLVCDYCYTPVELNIYAMDFSGRSLGYLNALPHTGGVVFADEENKIADLAELIAGIIDERKRLFAANNCGSFSDYLEIGKQRIPAILVIIDNYAPFREKYMDLSERFLTLISAGKTYGIYFVITGSTKDSIYYRVVDHISTFFTLKMNDVGNYFDILNIRPPIVPDDVKGRGITIINKDVIEFQVALALDGATEAERVSAIFEKYSEISKTWNGVLPVKLTNTVQNENADNFNYESELSINNRPAVKSVPPDMIDNDDDSLVVGSSVSGAALYGLNLTSDIKLVVCSDGDADLLKSYGLIIKDILSKTNRRVAFIDNENKRFREINNEFPLCKYISNNNELDSFFDEIRPELNERIEGNVSSKLFIVISDFNAFFEMITDEQADLMRKITHHINSVKCGVYFICGFDSNGQKSNDRLFIDLIVNSENYLICPRSYNNAADKIESYPLLHAVRATDAYFCQNEKSVKIRW